MAGLGELLRDLVVTCAAPEQETEEGPAPEQEGEEGPAPEEGEEGPAPEQEGANGPPLLMAPAP